jgi:mannose-6-phosphate isomerase-like protein (cupin superfamily)
MNWLDLHPGVAMATLATHPNISVDLVRVAPGTIKPKVVHWECDEVTVILSGCLQMTVDGKESLLGKNDAIVVPKGAVHSSANMTSEDVLLLAIATPEFQPSFEHVVED